MGNKDVDFSVINQIAFEAFGTKRLHRHRESGYTYFHGQRVGKLAVSLRQSLFPHDPSHDQALYIAGLFHDSTKGDEPHNVTGAELVQELLHSHLPPDMLAKIGNLVRLHNQRGKTDDHIAHLLQDADVLDHVGAQGVWLLFTVSASMGESVPHAISYWRDNPPQAKRRKSLNYKLSRALYTKRLAFFNSTVKQLAKEADGGLV